MKLTQIILVAGVTIVCAGTTSGEVVIREAPLKWEKVANSDGDELFSNLCAACHGAGGKGDGPAVNALDKAVPDLTVLAANNDGVYAHEKVEDVISGKYRIVAHGAIDMPMWGEQFMYVSPGPGVYSTPRRYHARERIHNLSNHIGSLQVYQDAENKIASN